MTPNNEPKFSSIPKSDGAAAPEGYGKLLTDAREAKGLTVEQVASQLRLSPKQISQMEAEDVTAFPTPVYARAHLRSYARLMGLIENDVVAAFNKTLGIDERDPNRRLAKATAGLIHKDEPTASATRGRSLVYLFFLALLCGVGYVGYYYYENYQADQLIKQEEAEKAIQAEKDRLAAEEKKRTEEAQQEELAKAAAQQKAEEEVRQKREQETAAQEAANTRLAATLDDQHGVMVTVPDDGSQETKLTFSIPQGSGRSWIGVYNSNGRFVFNKTLDSGSTEQVSASLPMRVTFGNTNAVDVTVNGRPLDYRDQLTQGKTKHFVIRKEGSTQAVPAAPKQAAAQAPRPAQQAPRAAAAPAAPAPSTDSPASHIHTVVTPIPSQPRAAQN